MLTFDVNLSPPTHQDLAAEKHRLTTLKKQLVKRSIVSDLLHSLVLLGLYLSGTLSGYGLCVVAGLGTAIALLLAFSRKKSSRWADLFSIGLIACVAAAVVAGAVHSLPANTLGGSLSAGLLTGSIVFSSSLIGRPMLQIFTGLEMLKSLAEYAAAEQEMMSLCRANPHLEDYRQQALQILRPNLTLGELQAMKNWLKS